MCLMSSQGLACFAICKVRVLILYLMEKHDITPILINYLSRGNGEWFVCEHGYLLFCLDHKISHFEHACSGKVFQRIAHTGEKPCSTCRVEPGREHLFPCDYEICPHCKKCDLLECLCPGRYDDFVNIVKAERLQEELSQLGDSRKKRVKKA